MQEREKLRRAQQQVATTVGFYIHFAVFAFVILLLFAINLTVLSEEWWVQWPLLGWGLGVFAHGLAVFMRQPRFIRRWQIRKIAQLKSEM